MFHRDHCPVSTQQMKYEVKIVCRFGGVLDESISVGLLRLNLKELLVSIEAEDSIGEDDSRRPPVN